MTNAKQSIEIIEGLMVELTPEQLEEVSRKLQSAKDKAKKAPEPKPKVGDWVRNIKDEDSDLTIGKVYKINDIELDGFVGVTDDLGDENGIASEDYEIIDKLTPFDRAGRKLGEFKKGDIVRVTKGGVSEINKGDIGVIVRDEVGDYPLVRVGYNEYYTYCELVTPVESRVDRAEGADVA